MVRGPFLFSTPGYAVHMPTLFDPLAWLASKGATVTLVAGEVRLLFESSTRQDLRRRIWRVITPYLGLLRLQLDVPPGTRPRTVQQLMAAGRIRVVEGRYRVVAGSSLRPGRQAE
jgi:hypothetical protein